MIEIIFSVLFMLLGLYLMDAPSSNGVFSVWVQHSIGLGCIYWIGYFCGLRKAQEK